MTAAPPGPAAAAPGTSPGRRRVLLFAPLALAAAGGAGFWAMLRGLGDGTYDPRGVPSALLGRPAPRADLPPVEGLNLPPITPERLASPGAPVLVNFWASWCAPCVIEHPQLMALSRRGITVLGVNHKDRPADAAAFLARHGNPYAAVSADAGRTAIEWGVYGLPETYLLDRGGLIRWRWAGPLTPDTLTADLDPLLRRHA